MGSATTGRVKTCTKILELSLARLISLLFLSIRMSSTSNKYFLIVYSIKRWKSQCGKMQTRVCLLLYKHSIKMSLSCIISKRLSSKFYLMVVSLWHLCTFWWTVSLLSLVAMHHKKHLSHYIHFHIWCTAIGSKLIEKTRHTKWNKLLNNLNFLFGK